MLAAIRRPAVFAAVLVALGSPPAAADVAADAVQLWLRQVATSLAPSGYRLSWDGVTGQSAGGVTVSGLQATDRQGRRRMAAATVTVTRPGIAANGALTAESLAIDALSLRPGDAVNAVEAERVTIQKPDLGAILALLAAPPGGAAAGSRPGWSRAMQGSLDIRALRLRGTTEPEPGAAPEPFHLRLARLSATGVQPDRIGRLEIDDLTMATEPAGGDLETVSIDRIRGTDLAGRQLVDPAAGDPRSVRPLAALADLRIGSLEIDDFRSSSALSGTTAIRRQWARTRTVEAGRSGVLQFGAEGVTSGPDRADSPMAPFVTALFPPFGVVSMNWTGDLAYDVRAASVGLRHRVTVDRFATLAVSFDLAAIPDLTLAEWETIGRGDPRLARMMIRGLSLSLTDGGGVDRAVAAMAEDKQASTATLRAALADQVGAFAAAFNPKRDPAVAGWIRTVQDFVRTGGTLALAAAKPIPAGAAAAEAGSADTLGDLVRRYGLTLTRR